MILNSGNALLFCKLKSPTSFLSAPGMGIQALAMTKHLAAGYTLARSIEASRDMSDAATMSVDGIAQGVRVAGHPEYRFSTYDRGNRTYEFHVKNRAMTLSKSYPFLRVPSEWLTWDTTTGLIEGFHLRTNEGLLVFGSDRRGVTLRSPSFQYLHVAADNVIPTTAHHYAPSPGTRRVFLDWYLPCSCGWNNPAVAR